MHELTSLPFPLLFAVLFAALTWRRLLPRGRG
jgi:hypothetical protein